MFVYLGQKILNLTEKGLRGVTYTPEFSLDLSVFFVCLNVGAYQDTFGRTFYDAFGRTFCDA